MFSSEIESYPVMLPRYKANKMSTEQRSISQRIDLEHFSRNWLFLFRLIRQFIEENLFNHQGNGTEFTDFDFYI